MILRIIDEIEKALNHDLYFAALNLALTLPDICGKAEYPSLRSTRERYIRSCSLRGGSGKSRLLRSSLLNPA